MAGICLADTDCATLSLDGFGNLQATIVISPDAGNSVECLANGLFAATGSGVVQTATTAATAPFNVTAVSPAELTVQLSSFVVTNPSATRTAMYLAIADLGSMDFFTIPTNAVLSSMVYKATSPGAYVLEHRFTATNRASSSERFEDATSPEFFSGTLLAAGTVTLQIQRRVQYSGGVGGQGTCGRIRWFGLVIPT